MANLLSAGTHTGEIVFTEQSNGRSQTNVVTLSIGQMDFLTEWFDLRDNDLDYQSITFTPDGSAAFYSVCRAPATNFPVDPSGGIPFATNAWSERAREVTLSAGHSVSLFGMRTNSFLAVFDGSISFFTSGTGEGSLSSHFEEPRISCLRATYEFEHSGRSWKELNDRVVVTFQNVPSLTVSNRNNFQMELFYDGRIRFTYLKLDARTGIVGLSRGNGIPPGFIESDFSAYPICMPPLALRAPTNVTEGAGTLTATVSRPFAETTALVVNFEVSGPAEISVPDHVLIPAGKTDADFQITIIDDPEADGLQAPTLTASAPGFASAHTTIFVSDNEAGSLALRLPALATEGETVRAVVALPAPAAKNIFVSLHSTDISEALLPAFTIIPAGATSAVFNLTLVDDALIDGPQSVTIVAQVTNWPAASANILVQDNESLALSLALRSQVSEAVASIDNGGIVSIPGQLSSNLVVTLESGDTSQLQVPSTVFILAGQTSAVFNLTPINDTAVDGPQTVTVSARAAGFIGATATVVVHDDEMPPEPFGPSPAHAAGNQPLSLTLSWKSGLENRLSNGDFESGTFAAWTRESSAPDDPDQRGVPAVRLAIDDGTYDPTEDDYYEGPGPAPPYAGFFSAFMTINSCFSGWGRIFQDITLPANASSATLSWVDRIANPRLPYSPTQYFAVEVRSTNDVLREVLFTTPPGFPETNDWTPRSYSLSHYLGETVRLVWKQEYHCYLMLTYLDNIALQVTSASATSFDVYLGTNANPGAAEFRGNTSNATWNVTNLQPDTVYFWRIVANRSASQTAGPVWQFRTRPLIDRLQWSAIATQQYVGQPIAIMLTAKGETNQILADFTAPVSLSGTALTGGQALFQDNFEDGNSTGWVVERVRPGPYNQQVTTNAAVGRYSFTLIGGNQKHVDGYYYAFPRFSMRPDQINFSVRSSATNKAGGFFAVGNDSSNLGVGVRFYMGASGRMGLLDPNAGLQGTNYVANRWYRISIVFDWTRRRVHCFVDGQQIASDVPFRNAFLDDVASLHLYNFDNTQAWWDEIEVIDGSRTIPIVVAPRATSVFANGVWVGNATVMEPAANMWLTASDASGHFGVSGNFSVGPDTDLDGDGLPDAWEVRHFGSTNSVAGADPDADGLTNLQEFRAGTNPNSASSTLRISSLASPNGILRMQFESVAGKAYQLEHTAVLNTTPWVPVGLPLLGTGQAIPVADPIEMTNQFYRVRIVP